MDYTIRKATIDDIPYINNLFIEMLNTIYDCSNSKGYSENELEFFFADNNSIIFVAETESKIIGYLSLCDHSDEQFVYLDDFSVNGDYRGCGIGKSLIEKAESYAVGLSVKYIALHVDCKNKNAHRLYEKLGYTDDTADDSRIKMIKQIL